MNEPAQYELWIKLPTSVTETDVDSYLHLRDCEVLSSKSIYENDTQDKKLFNNGDFKMWQILVELPTPRKDIRGYLESRVSCHLVASFETKTEIENVN